MPVNEIRIFDFFPPHHLEILNKNKLIMMLHLPRPARLKDPVNLAQILEIEKKYPDIKLIIAHVGRAYGDNDVGNAFEILGETNVGQVRHRGNDLFSCSLLNVPILD